MFMNLDRVIGLAGALAIVSAGLVVFHEADVEDGVKAAHIAPPAKDALVQALDLSHIAGFRYVDDRTLEVTDETGKNFKMELTEPCPGLEHASDFSLVTESYRNFDRFTAIGVKGSICTFKDFAPLPVGAFLNPAS
ncbi:MAG TPA: DUF6491 family protein [Steroidobacteraceae bacterium]|jgi:hypothetical protein|nr:DUF6491 family protein [Steroidobacteraceae bacterium]